MKIDLQLIPATRSWPELRDGVLAAEDAGYDTMWVFDHFLGSLISTGDTMVEPFTLLGALAAVTTRIGLGSLALNVANRTAPVIATGTASVQLISGGRFVLGLGAGASPSSPWGREHRLLHIPLGRTIAERHARLAGVLDELERLWSPTRDEELAEFPRPDPIPPIILGVNSAGLARIAGARCDGINVRSNHPELEELLDAAHTARVDAGRNGAWDVSVWAPWDEALLDPQHPDRRRWDAAGVNRLVLVWFERFDADAQRRATVALRTVR